jgi:hypothetical protein
MLGSVIFFPFRFGILSYGSEKEKKFKEKRKYEI